jgi:hypothetical protein
MEQQGVADDLKRVRDELKGLEEGRRGAVAVKATASGAAREFELEGNPRQFKVLNPKSQAAVFNASAKTEADESTTAEQIMATRVDAQSPKYLGLLGGLGAVADDRDADAIARILGAARSATISHTVDHAMILVSHYANH